VNLIDPVVSPVPDIYSVRASTAVRTVPRDSRVNDNVWRRARVPVRCHTYTAPRDGALRVCVENNRAA